MSGDVVIESSNRSWQLNEGRLRCSLDIFPLDDIITDTHFDRLTVEDIDNRIAEHEARIGELHAQITNHQRAIAKYKGHRNTHTDAITSKLPVEIFSNIILRYRSTWMEPTEFYQRGTHLLWLKLSHVSRHWRNIVCSIPALFSYIDLLPRVNYGSDVDITRNFLRFSGQLPLFLGVALEENGPRRAELLALISDHAHRVEVMHAVGHPMIEMYHSMRNLRSMTVSANKPDVFWSRNPLPSSLTRLILRGDFLLASPQEFLDAFKGLSKLQELEMLCPDLPDTWRSVPQITGTIAPLKTLVITGTPSCISHVLPYFAVTPDGSICIGLTASRPEYPNVLHLLITKLFDTNTALTTTHSIRIGAVPFVRASLECSIGSPESIGRRSILYGSRQPLGLELRNPPMFYPRLYLDLNVTGNQRLSVRNRLMEIVGREFRTPISTASRLVADLYEMDANTNGLKTILEQTTSLTTLEVLCRQNFYLVASSIRGWFIDDSGASTGILPLLHTLIVCREVDYESTLPAKRTISLLYDILRIRKEGGLGVHTLVVDFSRSEQDVTPELWELIEKLKDVAAELSYLPPLST